MTTKRKTPRGRRRPDVNDLTNKVGNALKALTAYFDANADAHEEAEIRQTFGFLGQSVEAAQMRALLAQTTSVAFEGRFRLGETTVALPQIAMPRAPRASSLVINEQSRVETPQAQSRTRQRTASDPDDFGIRELETDED